MVELELWGLIFFLIVIGVIGYYVMTNANYQIAHRCDYYLNTSCYEYCMEKPVYLEN